MGPLQAVLPARAGQAQAGAVKLAATSDAEELRWVELARAADAQAPQEQPVGTPVSTI